MKEIKKIKLFVKNHEKAHEIASKVEKLLLENNFIITEDTPDLALAIGGDGTFLKMATALEFNDEIYYAGIHAGTLGFLQEIKPEELEAFVNVIKKGTFKVKEKQMEEIIVNTEKETYQRYALNEIVLRREDLRTAKLSLYIEEDLLEDYAGDGLLISTTTGSTAYNLNYGGSMVHHALDTLQIVPIAPLNNRMYHNFMNSIVLPSDSLIVLIPNKKSQNISILFDGKETTYKNVVKIKIKTGAKKMKCIRMHPYNDMKVIHDKFLK